MFLLFGVCCVCVMCRVGDVSRMCSCSDLICEDEELWFLCVLGVFWWFWVWYLVFVDVFLVLICLLLFFVLVVCVNDLVIFELVLIGFNVLVIVIIVVFCVMLLW